jgi:hypothetical protein
VSATNTRGTRAVQDGIRMLSRGFAGRREAQCVCMNGQAARVATWKLRCEHNEHRGDSTEVTATAAEVRAQR